MDVGVVLEGTILLRSKSQILIGVTCDRKHINREREQFELSVPRHFVHIIYSLVSSLYVLYLQCTIK